MIMETTFKRGKNIEQNNQMTLAQMKKTVGEAWAFLENPVYKNGALTSASLLFYNADKSKVLEQFSKYKNGHFALYFFGTVNNKQVYIL